METRARGFRPKPRGAGGKLFTWSAAVDSKPLTPCNLLAVLFKDGMPRKRPWPTDKTQGYKSKRLR